MGRLYLFSSLTNRLRAWSQPLWMRVSLCLLLTVLISTVVIKNRRRTSDGVASQGGAAYSDEAYDQSQKYRNWLASHPLVQSCVKGTPGVRNFDPQDLLNAWRQDADMSMLDLLDSPLETEALIEGRARLQRLTHLKRAK